MLLKPFVRSAALSFGLCFCLCAHAARFESPQDALADAVDLMAERLELMPHVAHWKRANDIPILDERRERQVLDATVAKAQQLGIDGDGAARLFKLQIELARAIQERTAAAPAGLALRDLNSDLRPALDRLGERLLIAIYLSLPALNSPDRSPSGPSAGAQEGPPDRSPSGPSAGAQEGPPVSGDSHVARLMDAGLLRGEASSLVRSLHSLRTVDAPAQQRIVASGVLRIGMTGDYAPFSLERSGELDGFDVEASSELARALGARPVFIRTSWSALMADFRAGRFDIAMSGISITSEREREAAFSQPYQHGGKTAIVRCEAREQLDTLAEIDRPTVRAIVNPGGTNERFARERLTRTNLTVHPDNRTIFAEIAAGRADVMITDDVEVELQVRTNAALCRATEQTFTTSSKAILLPKDAALKSRVDEWLVPKLQSGEVSRRLDAAIELAAVP